MDKLDSGDGQTRVIPHFSSKESRIAVTAVYHNLQDSFKTSQRNQDEGAFFDLTAPCSEVIYEVDLIAKRVQRSRVLIDKLSAHTDGPARDLALSADELGLLGYAVFTCGVHGFRRALSAITNEKLGFMNKEHELTVANALRSQNEQAFALYKRLEPYNQDIRWLVWPDEYKPTATTAV